MSAKTVWTCQYEAISKWHSLTEGARHWGEGLCWYGIVDDETIEYCEKNLAESMLFLAKLKSHWIYNGVPAKLFPYPHYIPSYEEYIKSEAWLGGSNVTG